MDRQETRQTAAEFYARFSAGDVPGAAALLSSDATWWLAGERELSSAARWHTKDEIARLFTLMTSRLKGGLTMTVKNAIAEGDLVALEVQSDGELTNGRHYHNRCHTAMRVSDGKIREVREYSDTQHAHAVWHNRNHPADGPGTICTNPEGSPPRHLKRYFHSRYLSPATRLSWHGPSSVRSA
jgi:ketosteroid isomerase-like protein